MKTVLVTGGAQRLGRVICHEFAAGGWEVLCHYGKSEQEASSLQDELRAAGVHAHAVHGNLASESGRRELMSSAQKMSQSGTVHCLVNNASAFEPDDGRAFDSDAAMRQLEMNLIAPVSLARMMLNGAPSASADSRCVIHLLDQKVLNLNPDYFSYTLSKLALDRAVSLQAQALSPALRVCGVAPGLMFPSGPQTQQNFERASKVNLLRQAVDPQDVARACHFLATCSSVTGATLVVDCGQHLVPLERDVMFAARLLQELPT